MFDQVINIDKENAPAYNARGLIYDKLGQYDLALENFSLAIKIDARNPVFSHNRACCFRNIG